MDFVWKKLKGRSRQLKDLRGGWCGKAGKAYQEYNGCGVIVMVWWGWAGADVFISDVQASSKWGLATMATSNCIGLGAMKYRLPCTLKADSQFPITVWATSPAPAGPKAVWLYDRRVLRCRGRFAAHPCEG